MEEGPLLEKFHVVITIPVPAWDRAATRVLSLKQTHRGNAEQPRLANVPPPHNPKPREQP